MTILFPGRHHILTSFQHDTLKSLVYHGWKGKKIRRIVIAVTSANHENTRRNPLPLHLRTMAIQECFRDIGCEVKIYPIPDTAPTNEYAQYLLSHIQYQGGQLLRPSNTLLACSTPDVIRLFTKLGFSHHSMELVSAATNSYSVSRPFEVINSLVQAGTNWRKDQIWRMYAHLSSQQIYDTYNIGDLIVELFSDALLNDDADITETRNYQTYALSMDSVIHIKFQDIEPFIVEGKIVDVGCSTGSLVRLLAKHFNESDIIGIEAVRRFYEYCRSQEYDNPFVFFYRRNITDQVFKDHSINTCIYSSVLHEVYSYLGEKLLHRVLHNTYKQLKKGGRIIIRDVVGPEHPNSTVLLSLNEKDGKASGAIGQLSTYAKFFRFAEEFIPRKIKYTVVTRGGVRYIKLRLQDAYEYLSKMTYVDNWKSELHEEFGFYSYTGWVKLLERMGFRIVNGSKTFSNEYIIKNKYEPRATLYVAQGSSLRQIDYPPTNMILVGEK
ncbi:MAG: methyltransferase domain-containing protein [Patescibacteria group bacterium]